MSDRNQDLLRDARREREAGRPAHARSLYRKAADEARSEGDELLLAHALRHISDMAREAGQVDEALAAGREALDLYRSASRCTPLDIANAFRVTALALQDAKAFREAELHWRNARRLYEGAGIMAGIQECDENLDLLNGMR